MKIHEVALCISCFALGFVCGVALVLGVMA